jgi:hypothetical protein
MKKKELKPKQPQHAVIMPVAGYQLLEAPFRSELIQRLPFPVTQLKGLFGAVLGIAEDSILTVDNNKIILLIPPGRSAKEIDNTTVLFNSLFNPKN